MTLLTFQTLFLSAVFALVLAPLFIRIAPALRLIDQPGSLPHKQHDRPVPLTGGIVLLVSALAAHRLAGPVSGPLAQILLWSGVIFLFGLVDDRYGLSAPAKLVGQLLAAGGLLWGGIQVRLFPLPYSWVNVLITLVWLVGITNAFNFVDSMDGLAVGLAGLAAAFFMLVLLESGQPEISVFMAAVLGASIGTHLYNARPARLFLGDSGSQWLGFVLAAVGIEFTPVGFQLSQSWFVPILLVGVPVFDTTLIVVSRLRRRLPVYKARLDHTYHRLVHFGTSSFRAVITMHTAQLLLSSLAFVLLSLPPLWANVGFGVVLALGLGALLWMDSPGRWEL